MTAKKSNNVFVRPATQSDLATYQKASEQIQGFNVPQFVDTRDPKVKVFFALFDGTGLDVVHDQREASNIGVMYKQLQKGGAANLNVAVQYQAGTGTQGGLAGSLDAILGFTYQDRVNAMYKQFKRQAKAWLAEDPHVQIRVVACGFSRGAEAAAAFTRVVDQKQQGQVAQALMLFDPVATGVPSTIDRRPPPSVITGLQITARDEYRYNFSSTSIIDQGQSIDGRFLGVTTAGSHADIGGSYQLNGLSSRNFNLMANYCNALFSQPILTLLPESTDAQKNVIHDSVGHSWFPFAVKERQTIYALNPHGDTDPEAINGSLAQQFAYRPVGGVLQKPSGSDLISIAENVVSTLSASNYAQKTISLLDTMASVVSESLSVVSVPENNFAMASTIAPSVI